MGFFNIQIHTDHKNNEEETRFGKRRHITCSQLAN
jgi:hypothetical protein